ncbi:MAG: cation transporter [Planctomycetota bacterium]
MAPSSASQRINLSVRGIHCASCVGHVEKALARVPGVTGVTVDLASGTAAVTTDGTAAADKLAAAVREEGFEVPLLRAVHRVGGMHCVSCATSIASALRALPGVTGAEVDPMAGTAVIISIGTIDPAGVRAAVTGAGFEYLGQPAPAGVSGPQAAGFRQGGLPGIILGLAAGVTLMGLMAFHVTPWLQLAIAGPVFAYTGAAVFITAFQALRRARLTMDVMYGMGMGIAFAAALAATFGLLPHDFLFYETAVFLAAFLAIGRHLEAHARGRTTHAIRALMDLTPPAAAVERGGAELTIPAAEIVPGDTVIMKPGDRVPADGVITAGDSLVDEAMLTGEPMPVARFPGDRVTGGTVNLTGLIRFRADRTGADTVLARIIRVVQQASAAYRPPSNCRFPDPGGKCFGTFWRQPGA